VVIAYQRIGTPWVVRKGTPVVRAGMGDVKKADCAARSQGVRVPH
jgi:hypothetical protein